MIPCSSFVRVLAEIKRRYGILVDQNDDSAIPGDLRRIIFSSAVKHGGEKEYEKALDVYRNPQTPHHQIAAMLALTATRDPKLIQRTFDFVGTEEVKQQDVMYFFLVSLSITGRLYRYIFCCCL